MFEDIKADAAKRMESSYHLLIEKTKGLRTGRASTQLLEFVSVEAYGNKTPLSQVGTVSVSGPRSLTVQVWDNALVPNVEKALRESNIGAQPQTAGAVLRLQLPELTQERRKELCKTLGDYAENTRVSVRAVRRDAMDTLKKQDKVSEDVQRTQTAEIQKLTDKWIQSIDDLSAQKEQEILSPA